jgi:hypothetical protein
MGNLNRVSGLLSMGLSQKAENAGFVISMKRVKTTVEISSKYTSLQRGGLELLEV